MQCHTAFDGSWKEEVDRKVSEFSSLSADGEGSVRGGGGGGGGGVLSMVGWT